MFDVQKLLKEPRPVAVIKQARWSGRIYRAKAGQTTNLHQATQSINLPADGARRLLAHTSIFSHIYVCVCVSVAILAQATVIGLSRHGTCVALRLEW